MKTIAFFLEEPSARAFLIELIKNNFCIDPERVTIFYSVYEGKQDLEKNLEKRLKDWRTPNTTFLIMRDQDSGDCIVIKEKLQKKCDNADKKDAIVIVACHELESFFLGDLNAVEKGLGIENISKFSNQKKYRESDGIEKPSKELELLVKNRKRKETYGKIQGARIITPHMIPQENKSHSFTVLYRNLEKIINDTH
ncbi:MAG: DUF4276 family protein [Spirochaetales bacterium]|jgi:hypothetical protein|nr:DUF4276 family protein [Spirochaetales bacterium]